MTLATILSICLFCSAGTGELILASLSAVPTSTRSQTTAHEPQSPVSEQGVPSSSQSAPASPAPSASSPAHASSGQEKAKATKAKRHNRKKTNAADAAPDPAAICTPTAASNTATAGTTTTATPPSAPANGSPANGTPALPNCPPGKKIIHDGGTTEPPIQLVGGPGGAQASQQRDTTDQLLGSVESNLKKVAGHQLNSTQQEMMTQIQQFIEQSKAAVAAGDMERGHNLAMKAHLLSAELVKP
jgi:hypothetical protein